MANNSTAKATKLTLHCPTSAANARWVSCMPFVPVVSVSSLSSMMNAVQEQIMRVSTKTPTAWISPCFTGCEVLAVAATLGAVPHPASLL